MPTIEIKISDLKSLLGRENISRSALETLLEQVKGEVKEFLPEKDTAKVELNDSNRPDLWSPEGIVRQIHLGASKKVHYPFFESSARGDKQVMISKEVTPVRPYLAACAVKGIMVTEPILAQLIQTQEKLADTFGRKRQTVSVGLYRLQKIAFPVRYDAADPDQIRFTPLGFDHPMSLAEIIARHPKGIEYAGTLRGAKRYPILIDANDEVLAFPPIINSREIGEVRVGDRDLFVEVTGTDLRMVILALNIFACNLFDRGGTVEPVAIHFPEETPFGKTIRMPFDFSTPLQVALADFRQVLGEKVTLEEATSSLLKYGYQVSGQEKGLKVTAPPYRDDTMHPIDVIEDFVISRGIKSFAPEMPSTFTVGSLSLLEQFSDRLREEMIGFGFQEIVSNVLGSRQDFIERMRIEQGNRPEGRGVEIENPMTERFSLLRPWLLPSLLRVEGASSKAFYPHRIFEVGEVAQLSASGEKTETSIHLAALISHPTANFSELHAVLEAFFYDLSVKYRLESISHPTFIEGRAGAILVNGKEAEAGLIGEVDPEVLSRWQIGMPSAAIEIQVESLSSSKENKKGQ